MYSKRDIILVAGQNSVGKTTAICQLMEIAQQKNVAYELQPISDFTFLLSQVRADDARGGYHHYHPWCPRKVGGHTHYHEEPEVPFIVTDDRLVNTMFHHFFDRLSSLPRKNTLWFVEWTGGINKNPPDEPAAQVDFSFEKIARMFHNDTYFSRFMERIYAVIHPQANLRTRYNLNGQQDTPHSIADLEESKCSPRRTEAVLDLFGKDDFAQLESLLRDKGVRKTYTVQNKGDSSYYVQLKDIAQELYSASLLELTDELVPAGASSQSA